LTSQKNSHSWIKYRTRFYKKMKKKMKKKKKKLFSREYVGSFETLAQESPILCHPPPPCN